MQSTRTAEYRAFLRLLKRARLSVGMTQHDVAAALRVPQSRVSRCESGERRVDVVELMAFARLYRCSANDLIPKNS